MSTIVITGANRGIGLELARQRAADHRIIAICRKATPEIEELASLVVEGVELTDDAQVGSLADRLAGEEIDVLINNAGILHRGGLDDLDIESIRQQFEVNAVGPLKVTRALAPLVRRGGKVVIVTSRMGSIADNTSGGMYGYRMSKAAVNMAGVSLAHDLKADGVSVAILHPGFVKTEMTGGTGNVTAAESAAMLWARIDGLAPESSGTFWHASGEVLPW